MLAKKVQRRQRVRRQIRKKITGTADIPRLSVFRSNKDIYAQLIDDNTRHTLASASSRDKGIAAKKGTKVEKAKMVGEALAKKAAAADIKTIVFDRGGYLYHGRVKALAEGMREGGIKF